MENFENLYKVEQIDNDNNIERTNEERIMELQKGIILEAKEGSKSRWYIK